MKLRSFLIVLFIYFAFLFTPFFGVRAANEETATVTDGPFSLASAWGGVLNVSGSPAVMQSIGAGYTAGTAEGSLVVVSGDTLSFSHTSADPSGTFGGGLFSGESLQGKWVASLSDRSECSASSRAFSIGADQYSFVLCGVQPAFSLSSNNSTVVSCSGMVCTANSVGSARITMSVAGAPVKVWGIKSGESNWTELVSSTLPNATLSWNATVVLPPTLTFSMSGTNPIPYDTSTTLSWDAKNVVASSPCIASGDWSGTKAASGSYDTGNLKAQRSYTLRCTGPSGDSVTATKTVQVGSPTPGPSVTLWAGVSPVPSGATTTISWTSSNADTCVVEGDWINPGPRPTNGSESTGPITSAKVYLIKCSNAGGTTPKSVLVDVIPPLSSPSFRDFSADPNPIPYNGSTTLSWDVQNASSCSASSDAAIPLANWNGTVSPFGSQTISGLTSTTKFFLSCTGAGGTTSGTPAEVLVAPMGLMPPDITLSADGGVSTPIPYNTSTRLHWSTARADSCETFDGDDGWYHLEDDGLPHTSGDYTTSNLPATTSFTLRCSNMAGTLSKTIIVSVGSPSNPVILNFSADRYSISSGESINIQWDSENAASCYEEEFDAATGDWLRYAYANLSGNFSRSPEKSTTYVMTCSSPLPSTVKKSLTVTVDPLITPGPTSDPPRIVFEMDASSDRYGFLSYNTGTTVRWTVQNATSCMASSSPNISTWMGPVDPVSGSAFTGNLRNEVIFSLDCTGPGGNNNDWLHFYVGNSSLSGPSLSLWADDFAVLSGRSTKLHWTSEGVVGQCEASGDWSGSKDEISPLAGVNTGALTKSATYRLMCANAGGSVTASVNVLVGSTIPTASLSFWVDDPVVPVGGSTMLRWNAQNVTACTASASGDPVQSARWNGSVPFIGGQSTGVLTVNQEYTLTCKDATGLDDIVAKTRVGAGSTFGSGPEIVFSADAYVVPPGTVPILSLQAFFASACRMNDGIGVTMLLPSVNMTLNSAPYVEAITAPKTYTVECTDATDPLSPSALWYASSSLTIKVGQVLLCPASAPVIVPGETVQFDAWYTEDTSASCATDESLRGMKVTNPDPLGQYITTWSVVDGDVVFVPGSPGLIRGVGPGAAHILVTHRPAAATIFFPSQPAGLVVGRPITCYRCDTSSFSCVSETQFDLVNNPAQCSSTTFASLNSCRFSCFKDRWEEVAP